MKCVSTKFGNARDCRRLGSLNYDASKLFIQAKTALGGRSSMRAGTDAGNKTGSTWASSCMETKAGIEGAGIRAIPMQQGEEDLQ